MRVGLHTKVRSQGQRMAGCAGVASCRRPAVPPVQPHPVPGPAGRQRRRAPERPAAAGGCLPPAGGQLPASPCSLLGQQGLDRRCAHERAAAAGRPFQLQIEGCQPFSRQLCCGRLFVLPSCHGTRPVGSPWAARAACCPAPARRGSVRRLAASQACEPFLVTAHLVRRAGLPLLMNRPASPQALTLGPAQSQRPCAGPRGRQRGHQRAAGQAVHCAGGSTGRRVPRCARWRCPGRGLTAAPVLGTGPCWRQRCAARPPGRSAAPSSLVWRADGALRAAWAGRCTSSQG